MRVSVIIPLYNQGEFVAETIESALVQSYKNVEVIVVNDKSTDGSVSVAEKYQPHIKIVNREKNGGLSAARNSGIEVSTGELFLPLDADDVIEPNYLERTVPKMVDPQVGIVSTYMRVFYLGRDMCGPANSSYPIFAPTLEQITNGNTLPVCSLVRKAAAAEAGYYSIEMRQGSEDWAMWAAIVHLNKWKVEIVPEYLFNYRVHLKSFSRSANMAPFEANRAAIRAKYGK